MVRGALSTITSETIMRSLTPQHEPIRSSGPSAASPAAQIRVGQILILAMIMGVIMFGGVALYLRSTATVSKAIDPNNQGVMLLTLAAIFVATLAASLAARTLYVAQIRRRAEREGASESLVWVAGSRFSQMAILR